MERTVLAIDPGKNKCGMALVRRDANGSIELLWRFIATRDQVPGQIHNAFKVGPASMIVMGNGTTSRALVSLIREELPSIGILLVDEQDTSVQARERYWEHHPRKGWRRFLPSSLQVPPEPVDDFAAFVLAERVLL